MEKWKFLTVVNICIASYKTWPATKWKILFQILKISMKQTSKPWYFVAIFMLSYNYNSSLKAKVNRYISSPQFKDQH